MRCTRNEQIREVLDVKTLSALDEGIQQVENGQRWSIDEAFEVVR